MFAKLFTVVAFLAAATTALGQTCDAGTLQCCQNVGNAANDPNLARLLLVIGGITANLDVNVGTGCSSSNGNCGASLQKVCCENTEFVPMLAIGCSPA